MHADNNNTPKLPNSLGSTEHRTRLATKLNCLIAVLEVAITKLSKSMQTPGANQDRLTKICRNLESTLSTCQRAKANLDGTPSNKQAAGRDANSKDKASCDYVELTSIDEHRKFRNMAPITKHDLEAIDFDELSQQLSDG